MPIRPVGRGRDEDFSSPTGSPEAVARPRLPQNVACGFTLWDSTRDALALLDRREIDRAIFVGTSQGGFVSLRAAPLAPDRGSGLAVMGYLSCDRRPGAEDR